MTHRSYARLLAPCLVFSLSLQAQSPSGAPAPAAQVLAAPEASPQQPPAAEAGHGGGGHHGPAITLFGHELTPGQQFLIKLFNFSVFAGALVLALKGVLSSAFRTRAKELEEQLTQAERERIQAEEQLRELDGRMAGLQAELDTILSKAEAEAEGERTRIVEAARAEAAAILAQTRFDIESQQRQAEQELRALVAQLAVEGARKQLEVRLAGGEASGVMNRAINQVGGV